MCTRLLIDVFCKIVHGATNLVIREIYSTGDPAVFAVFKNIEYSIIIIHLYLKAYYYILCTKYGMAADAMGSMLLWLIPAPIPSLKHRPRATSGATLLINPPTLPDEARGAAIGRTVPAMTSRRDTYPLS